MASRFSRLPLREALVLGAIVLAAVAVRLYRLGEESLWADEAASWAFARLPFMELWSAVAQYENNPPLYYTLLKGWGLLFGDSEFALRSLSVFIGGLTIPVVYLIGREISDRRDGAWLGAGAALVIALHPLQIQYAQEARAYALLTLGFALVLLALVHWIKSPQLLSRPFGDGWRIALLFVCGCELALWSHYTAAPLIGCVVGASVLLLLIRSGARLQVLGNVAILGGIVLALWLPGALWLLDGLKRVHADFWIERPSVYSLISTSDRLLGSGGVLRTVEAELLALGVVGFIALAGAWLLVRRGQRRTALALVAGAALPILISFVASLAITPIFLVRTLIWVQIAAAPLIAAAVLWLPHGWRRAAGLAVLVAALMLTLSVAYPGKEEWRPLVRTLDREIGPDDVVFAYPGFAQVPLMYYMNSLRGKSTQSITWYPRERHSAYPSLRRIIEEPNPTADEMLARIGARARKAGRVWLVVRAPIDDKTIDGIEKTLSARRGASTVRFGAQRAVRLLVYSNESFPVALRRDTANDSGDET